jgi:hypothetical protein
VVLGVAVITATAAPSCSETLSRRSARGETRSWAASSGQVDGEESSTSEPARARLGPELSGRVRSVDRANSTVTLEDGTVLRLPPDIARLNEAALRDGVSVEAACENQGGNNVVRDLRVIGR